MSSKSTDADPDVRLAEWKGSLDSPTREQIKALHRVVRRWNPTVIVFLMLWASAAWMATTVAHPAARVPAYMLSGFVLSALANFMHEAAHGNVFRNRRLDRLYGFLAGVPMLLSFSAYRYSHMLHHRHTRRPQDPDEFFNLSGNRTLLSILSVFWLFCGTLVYLVYLPFVALVKAPAPIRKSVAAEYTATILFWAGLWIAALETGLTPFLVHGWLVPILIASVWINFRYWAEHMLTEAGHPLRDTRTVLSTRAFSLLNVNMNYHLEHHLFPGVPWYNLPRLHRILGESLRRAGAPVYRSYVKYFLVAFRQGIHGKAMGTGQSDAENPGRKSARAVRLPLGMH